ncbi:GNAT family N-acetyltransferase [Streptomyces sp. NPDC002851]
MLLVARYGGVAAGTSGVRRLDADTAELARAFLRAELGGKGGAGVLMAAAEEAARGFGAERIVLDTRLDLIEARSLYVRHGFAEILAYGATPGRTARSGTGKKLP